MSNKSGEDGEVDKINTPQQPSDSHQGKARAESRCLKCIEWGFYSYILHEMPHFDRVIRAARLLQQTVALLL